MKERGIRQDQVTRTVRHGEEVDALDPTRRKFTYGGLTVVLWNKTVITAY